MRAQAVATNPLAEFSLREEDQASIAEEGSSMTSFSRLSSTWSAHRKISVKPSSTHLIAASFANFSYHPKLRHHVNGETVLVSPGVYFWPLLGEQALPSVVESLLIFPHRQEIMWQTKHGSKRSNFSSFDYLDLCRHFEETRNGLPIAVSKRTEFLRDCQAKDGSKRKKEPRTSCTFLYTCDQIQAEIDNNVSECLQIQRFVKARGRRPWMVRAHWCLERGCQRVYVLTSSSEFPSSNNGSPQEKFHQLSADTQDPERCNVIYANAHVWPMPAKSVSDLAELLRKHHHFPISDLVADFIQNDFGSWNLLQIKAFQLEEGTKFDQGLNGFVKIIHKDKHVLKRRRKPHKSCPGTFCKENGAQICPKMRVPRKFFIYQRIEGNRMLKTETELSEMMTQQDRIYANVSVAVCQKCFEGFNKRQESRNRLEIIEAVSKAPLQPSTNRACLRLYERFEKGTLQKSIQNAMDFHETTLKRGRKKRSKARRTRELPQGRPESRKFSSDHQLCIGDEVSHSEFGKGIIIETQNDQHTVHFDSGLIQADITSNELSLCLPQLQSIQIEEYF